MTGEFDFLEYAGPVRLGPFLVEPVPVVHPVASYALRVAADGRVLTYSGDTAPCTGLDDASSGADLLLAEASFLDGVENPEGIHLTGREAGELAERAAVRRLVITHVPPWHDAAVALDAAREAFAGPLELARPGATYELSSHPHFSDQPGVVDADGDLDAVGDRELLEQPRHVGLDGGDRQA